MLQGIIAGLIQACILSTIVFVLLFAVSRTAKARAVAFLDVSNKLLLLLLLAQMVFWVKDVAWPFFAPQEAGSWRVRNIFSYIYLFSVPVLGFTFQLLFIQRQFRIKIWATIISVILLLLLWFMGPLVAAFTYLYRDYLPGSWTYYRPTIAEIMISLALSTAWFTGCWQAAKRTLQE